MILSRKVIQTIINYKHVASKDETRPQLCSVKLELIAKDLIELVACDGVILIKSTHKIEDEKGIKVGTSTLLSIDDVKDLEQFLKRNPDMKRYDFDIQEERITFSCAFGSREYRPVLREYPAIEKVFPTRFEAKESIILDPDLITRLGKAVYGARKKNCSKGFEFQFSAGDLGPIKAETTHEGIEHYLLLMPKRSN